MLPTSRIEYFFAEQDSKLWERVHESGFTEFLTASSVPDIFGLGYVSISNRFKHCVGNLDLSNTHSDYVKKLFETGKEDEKFVLKKIRDHYMNVSKYVIQPGLLISADHPYLAASCDAIVVGPEDLTNVEIKSTQKDLNVDEPCFEKTNIPYHWIIQMQTQMLVTKLPETNLFIYHRPTGKIYSYNVYADPDIQTFIVEEVKDFWLDLQKYKSEDSWQTRQTLISKYATIQRSKKSRMQRLVEQYSINGNFIRNSICSDI